MKLYALFFINLITVQAFFGDFTRSLQTQDVYRFSMVFTKNSGSVYETNVRLQASASAGKFTKAFLVGSFRKNLLDSSSTNGFDPTNLACPVTAAGVSYIRDDTSTRITINRGTSAGSCKFVVTDFGGQVKFRGNVVFSFISDSSAPTILPTSAPTNIPTHSPSSEPTIEPTIVPTNSPTTQTPSQVPTLMPTTKEPTFTPTQTPTTSQPTVSPTIAPTVEPTYTPTQIPTQTPSEMPTISPTYSPTVTPSIAPSYIPTASPTGAGAYSIILTSTRSSSSTPYLRHLQMSTQNVTAYFIDTQFTHVYNPTEMSSDDPIDLLDPIGRMYGRYTSDHTHIPTFRDCPVSASGISIHFPTIGHINIYSNSKGCLYSDGNNVLGTVEFILQDGTI